MENINTPEITGGASDAVSSEECFVTEAKTAVDTAEERTAEIYATDETAGNDEVADGETVTGASADGGSAVTQEQLNSIVARETGKAVEKTLRELGFNGTGKGREQLKQFRAQLDERAAEYAAQTERLAQTEAVSVEKDNEIAQLRAMLDDERAARLLVTSGVGENAMEKALCLVKGLTSSGQELSTSVAEIVEKYPHLVNGKREIPRFSAPTGGNDGFAAMKSVFRKK